MSKINTKLLSYDNMFVTRTLPKTIAAILKISLLNAQIIKKVHKMPQNSINFSFFRSNLFKIQF